MCVCVCVWLWLWLCVWAVWLCGWVWLPCRDALINYACFAQTFAKSPGWRPSFKYSNIYTSGAGCGLCVIVMFLIDTKNNCVLALATCFIGILLYKCTWTDWRVGISGRLMCVCVSVAVCGCAWLCV